MEKNKDFDSLEKFLDILIHAKGIKIINTDIQDDKKIISILKSKKPALDFDDGLHYFICKSLNLKIVSFDRHFDKTDIRRLEPKDVTTKNPPTL